MSAIRTEQTRASVNGLAAGLRRFSTYLYQRPRLALLLLLAPPLLWLGVVYLGSLVALLLNSFYFFESFGAKITPGFTLENYIELLTTTNLSIITRTVTVAVAVTIACMIFAFPLAYYMAWYASPRMKGILYLAVLLPLWSNYLVRVYAWKLILAEEGVLNWFISLLGLRWIVDFVLQIPEIGGRTLATSLIGMWIVFVYVWLPYMILPIQAALERVPKSVLEASSDLGARPWRTFWHVTLPLVIPGVAAGSIFTFSLTLGDYVIPGFIGDSSYFIGASVYNYQGTVGNLPLAAAFTAVPVVIMGIYLLLARRLGAFDAL